MLELLVADAGDVAEFVERRGPRGGDAVDGGIVQHDIGRHAALARDLGAPCPQRRLQAGIGGALGLGARRQIAAP